MDVGRTLLQARRRANLTQRELATRTGIPQPTIARIERGRSVPRVDTLARLLRECGERLDAVPLLGEGVDRTLIRNMLALSPAERLQRSADEANNMAELLSIARMTDQAFNPKPMLETLTDHGVRFVLIGGLAARMHGSPSVTGDLDICYARHPDDLERLARALYELKATLRGAPEGVPFQLDARTLASGDHFTFATTAGALDCLGTPAGTRGFDQLDANAVDVLIDRISIRVASLDDLIRMKTAAGRPKDRVEVEILGALRDELEGR